MHPLTPPRKPRTAAPVCLRTPQSTHKLSSLRKPTGESYGSLAPITPEFTPQRSPRHRKKGSSDFGFLLPTPSTVGSGRKTNALVSSHKTLKPVTLKFDTLLDLNKNLTFESDADEPSPFEAVSEDESDVEMSPCRRKVRTPRNKIVDDDFRNKIVNPDFSDDEDNEISIKREKLVNPFVADGFKEPRKVLQPSDDIDYATQMELVSKTGERKVIKLTKKQMSIKPKKLDFSV